MIIEPQTKKRHSSTGGRPRMTTRRNKGWFMALVCALVMLLVCCSTPVQAETEVKWTGNPDDADGGGPLPLSQNQRQQLLQLEQTIMQSPDPQGTLMQVAQANGMQPQELVDLLEKNHQAMVESGDIPANGGGAMRRRGGTNIVWKALTSLTVVLTSAAKANPKAFSVVVTALLLCMYMAIMAPRTGLVLSSNKSLLSKGPTTIFQPPTSYMHQVLESSKIVQKDPTYKQSFPLDSLSIEEEDGVVWHKLNKQSKKLFKQAASATVTLEVEDEDDEEAYVNTYFAQAERVLDEGQFTEWVEPKGSIKMVAGDSNSVLVVKGMGDYNRYGLLFLRPVERKETSDRIGVVYSTLRGSHFDGQLHVEVLRDEDAAGRQVQVKVHLIVPKKGRTLAKGRATKIVERLSDSIAQSIKTHSLQIVARKSQSARFQGKAKARATERRQTRHRLEKEIEEMSAERRRRWQRQNPNAGSYRPSNRRQQSPNNC